MRKFLQTGALLAASLVASKTDAHGDYAGRIEDAHQQHVQQQLRLQQLRQRWGALQLFGNNQMQGAALPPRIPRRKLFIPPVVLPAPIVPIIPPVPANNDCK